MIIYNIYNNIYDNIIIKKCTKMPRKMKKLDEILKNAV